MFSHTGRTNLHVETIANAIWLVDSHLDIFAPFSCELSFMHIHDVYNNGSGGDCYDESFWLPLNPVKYLIGY